jgi:hypothetical protein
LLPALLLHVVLSNYSGHDFTALYGSLFLCVSAACLMHFAVFQKRPTVVYFLIVTMIIGSIFQYFYINRPGEISFSGEKYSEFQEKGIAIKKTAAADEVVFLIDEKPSPEMVWYAGRNIQQVRSRGDAFLFLKKHLRHKGIIFSSSGEEIKVSERINLDPTIEPLQSNR